MEKLNYINLYSTDPTFNLAAEQYVFDSLPRDKSYFMLWQNDNAVIIGKYQNAQAEIDEKYIRDHNIKVVRRLSGGGAVYHDMGNLNFTFISDSGDLERLNMKVFCEPVISVLQSMGINAEINGRNDMTIDGQKFSGNAQYMRSGRIMHHGTMLFDSDLTILTNALKVDPSKIESKGIKSVKSRVTNISAHAEKEFTLEAFRDRLIDEIAVRNGGEEYVFSQEEIDAIKKIQSERYSTWEWNYGRSPQGIVKKEKRIPECGKIEVYARTEHGLFVSLEFFGDFFSSKDPEELAHKFIGVRANEEEIQKVLNGVDNIGDYFHGMNREQLRELLV